jgi:acyl-CoA thioesterase-1
MILLPILLLTAHLPVDQVADVAEFRRPLVELLQAQWPKNRTVNIVCHGHSVPAGYFRTPVVQTFDAYPHLLHLTIKKKYPHAVVNVVVTAIGGEDSEEGAKRFSRDVMNLHPDVVTIDYGLNDRRIGLEKARIAWEEMIASAKKGGAQVILLTPSWDLSSKAEKPDDPLFHHAVQIRELAKKHGVGLADSFESFSREKGSGRDVGALMSQSNHPNRAGHELILRRLLPWFGIAESLNR